MAMENGLWSFVSQKKRRGQILGFTISGNGSMLALQDP